jgi:hypothetical protein
VEERVLKEQVSGLSPGGIARLIRRFRPPVQLKHATLGVR